MIALFRKVFHLVKHVGHIQKDQMELHEHLRDAREKAGMSVKKVAAHLDVTRVQVWRMEKKADFISIARLKKLADLYGRLIPSFFDDSINVESSEISYQIVGMAFDAVEQVARQMSVRPSADAVRSATLAVIRTQQKRWADNSEKRFDPQEFVALIEQHFEESNNR